MTDLRAQLPRRVASNHLVYRGATKVLTLQQHGRVLEIGVDPDDPRLAEYLMPLDHLLKPWQLRGHLTKQFEHLLTPWQLWGHLLKQFEHLLKQWQLV